MKNQTFEDRYTCDDEPFHTMGMTNQNFKTPPITTKAYALADPGAQPERPPPQTRPNSFVFAYLFAEKYPCRRWAPPQQEILDLPLITGADPGFPIGGVPTLIGGSANLRHRCFLVKTFVKMKEFGPVGGGAPETFVCRSATGLTLSNCTMR